MAKKYRSDALAAIHKTPRVRIVVASIDFKEWGAMMERRDGSIRTNFQEQGAG